VTPAVTLHKLLHIRPDQAAGAAPELAVDLVIVDEASMIDLDMMARLLAAVPLTASLILLGDKDQLASVEAGAVMAQLCAGADSDHYSQATVAWLQALAGVDVQPWSATAVQPGPTPTTPLASALAQQTVMLRYSHRFRDDSGIGIWARTVNAGGLATVRELWRHTESWHAVETVEAPNMTVQRLQPAGPKDVRLLALARCGWQPWLAWLAQWSPLGSTG
jgi:exodeoxyribonuclease V alpha subunit